MRSLIPVFSVWLVKIDGHFLVFLSQACETSFLNDLRHDQDHNEPLSLRSFIRQERKRGDGGKKIQLGSEWRGRYEADSLPVKFMRTFSLPVFCVEDHYKISKVRNSTRKGLLRTAKTGSSYIETGSWQGGCAKGVTEDEVRAYDCPITRGRVTSPPSGHSLHCPCYRITFLLLSTSDIFN